LVTEEASLVGAIRSNYIIFLLAKLPDLII